MRRFRILSVTLVACCGLIAEAQETSTPQIASVKSATFEQRLTALDLALSTIVAERPYLWRFDPLQAEASALLVEATTEADRQAVRALSQRIERFSELASRYQQLTQTPREFRLTKGRALPAESEQSSLTRSQAANKEYDAVGVLRPVVSKRENAPRYALVDGRGKVTTFVTPAPEVDLQPLLGKRIGVRGTRGFIPEYKRDHLTATLVTPLKTVRR